MYTCFSVLYVFLFNLHILHVYLYTCILLLLVYLIFSKPLCSIMPFLECAFPLLELQLDSVSHSLGVQASCWQSLSDTQLPLTSLLSLRPPLGACIFFLCTSNSRPAKCLLFAWQKIWLRFGPDTKSKNYVKMSVGECSLILLHCCDSQTFWDLSPGRALQER